MSLQLPQPQWKAPEPPPTTPLATLVLVDTVSTPQMANPLPTTTTTSSHKLVAHLQRHNTNLRHRSNTSLLRRVAATAASTTDCAGCSSCCTCPCCLCWWASFCWCWGWCSWHLELVSIGATWWVLNLWPFDWFTLMAIYSNHHNCYEMRKVIKKRLNY